MDILVVSYPSKLTLIAHTSDLTRLYEAGRAYSSFVCFSLFILPSHLTFA